MHWTEYGALSGEESQCWDRTRLLELQLFIAQRILVSWYKWNFVTRCNQGNHYRRRNDLSIWFSH